MEALTTIAVNTIGPCVEALEKLSFLGVNTHFVKNAFLVSNECVPFMFTSKL